MDAAIINVTPKRDGLPPIDAAGFCWDCRHGPPEEDQVATAVAYLATLTPSKSSTCSSYLLKHRAGAWGRANGMAFYVSNGAMIAAAVRLGLTIEPHGMNAAIGVSRRGVRALKEKERY